MRADQVDGLRAQQIALAEQVQRMLDTPESERPTAPKALRAWLHELKAGQDALAQVAQLVSRAERAAERLQKADAAAERRTGEDDVLLASVPKGIGYEIRVSLRSWAGRRTIDLRTYAQGDDGEMRATRKGIQFDVKRLPSVLDALKKAQQHV